MNQLFYVLLILLGTHAAFAMGDEHQEPSSSKAQEGRVLYAPINPSVNFDDEEKIQKDDQNMTRHGQAK